MAKRPLERMQTILSAAEVSVGELVPLLQLHQVGLPPRESADYVLDLPLDYIGAWLCFFMGAGEDKR